MDCLLFSDCCVWLFDVCWLVGCCLLYVGCWLLCGVRGVLLVAVCRSLCGDCCVALVVWFLVAGCLLHVVWRVSLFVSCCALCKV